MPRDFFSATAEQLVYVVEAIVALPNCDKDFVIRYTDLPTKQAENALAMSTDLGLVIQSGNTYYPNGPLPRLFVSKREAQRASALRIALEDYEPFIRFRSFIVAGNSPDDAARKTRTVLDLAPHREEVKDALLSLGTYSGALVQQGGGSVVAGHEVLENELETLASGCDDLASAEQFISGRLGPSVLEFSRTDVLVPLSNALVRALQGDGSGALTEAGNGFESFLTFFGSQLGHPVDTKHGINSKVEEIKKQAGLPGKIVNMTKYLGHLRNAADHGIDADVGASWTISTNTGLEFVYVACSAIQTMEAWRNNKHCIL